MYEELKEKLKRDIADARWKEHDLLKEASGSNPVKKHLNIAKSLRYRKKAESAEKILDKLNSNLEDS